MEAIAALRSDMDKLKKESKAALPEGFSEFNLPGRRPAVRKRRSRGMFPVAVFYYKVPRTKDPRKMSRMNLTRRLLFVSGMREEDYKAIIENDVTLRPSDCHTLTQVECNAQVLDALPAEWERTKAATIVIKVAHNEDHLVVAHEVAMLNGALALLGNAHFQNNLTQRHIIKWDINPKYSHLCSDKAPITGLLFGDDLSQVTRKIEAKRLKSKFTSKKPFTFWTSALADLDDYQR
ncbi:hypothetical protein E2C01_050832 [Portunus trituberculatus]|uniref:Uncharacterized protein n=1 Tax=Portunus trituberculatus TaxID=210409 RepID=A0A5B7GH15_PORTR|nr:hypothetical protein [Portunus trituberculatus]